MDQPEHTIREVFAGLIEFEFIREDSKVKLMQGYLWKWWSQKWLGHAADKESNIKYIG